MKLPGALSLWFLALPLLLDAPSTRIVFTPEEGAELEVTYEATSDLQLVDYEFTLIFDSEEVEDEDHTEFSLEYREFERLRFVDRFVEVDEERLIEVERTFDELSRTTKGFVSYDGDSDETDDQEQSELEGVAVVFEWSEEEEEYLRAFADDEEGDEDLLELLELTMLFE